MKIKSCMATDTRLMGVVGVYLDYVLSGVNYSEIFVIDYDAKEISRHDLLKSPSIDAIKAAKDEAFGGLGGTFIPIDVDLHFLPMFRSAKKAFIDFDKKVCSREIAEMTKNSPIINEREKKAVGLTYSEDLLFPNHDMSDFELMHYFIIRYFAADSVSEYLSIETYPEFEYGMMVSKNSLREIEDEENDETSLGLYEFSCIAHSESYELISGTISVTEGLVDRFAIDDITALSDDAAVELLKKQEVVSLFHIESENFEEVFYLENRKLSPHLYPNGRLYVSYKSDNSHVDSDEYNLNDDVEIAIFITDSNQIILSSSSVENDIIWTEKLMNRYGGSLMRIGGWVFEKQVFLSFVNSDFVDFMDWLDQWM